MQMSKKDGKKWWKWNIALKWVAFTCLITGVEFLFFEKTLPGTLFYVSLL